MSPALATGFFTTRATWEAQPIYGFIFFTLFHGKKNDAAVHGVTKSWTHLETESNSNSFSGQIHFYLDYHVNELLIYII